MTVSGEMTVLVTVEKWTLRSHEESRIILYKNMLIQFQRLECRYASKIVLSNCYPLATGDGAYAVAMIMANFDIVLINSAGV